MKRARGPYTNNVIPINVAKTTVQVELYCSICKKKYPELVGWRTKLEKLRCPTCVNPVELVYPKPES
jgi:DNA-directed RNA polymerase subunit RPC12/RpoP